MAIDYRVVASECLRAMRGRRSQRAFGRLFGFGTNVVYRWEAGSRAPRAFEVFAVLVRIGRPIQAVLEEIDVKCVALRDVPVGAREYPSALLRIFVAGRHISDVAREARIGRLRVARALAGETDLRWPVFLRLLDVLTGRLEEFVSAWVEVGNVPSLAERYAATIAWRRAAYELPWTEAIASLAESGAYREARHHRPGWFAERLGIDVAEVLAAVAALDAAGVIARRGDEILSVSARDLDTHGDPEAFAAVKRFWAARAAERTEGTPAGLSGYLVCCTSEAGLQQMQRILRDAFRQVRALQRLDQGDERVVLLTMGWTPLDGEPIVADVGGGRSP